MGCQEIVEKIFFLSENVCPKVQKFEARQKKQFLGKF